MLGTESVMSFELLPDPSLRRYQYISLSLRVADSSKVLTDYQDSNDPINEHPVQMSIIFEGQGMVIVIDSNRGRSQLSDNQTRGVWRLSIQPRRELMTCIFFSWSYIAMNISSKC